MLLASQLLLHFRFHLGSALGVHLCAAGFPVEAHASASAVLQPLAMKGGAAICWLKQQHPQTPNLLVLTAHASFLKLFCMSTANLAIPRVL